ncbi:radical SAM protein [Coleofasciculus sp. F4-SAH-05]|uniref:radical SAM protein n=1 Tax=Coleofasciculus sp. F4-SAH-05 TaxID=3069525 RepID=UPI0032FD13B1
MASTGECRKILHIHPTRRCNLQCLHCYSSSSPQEQEELDEGLLQQAIADASAEGYTVANISGGEPLVYKPLDKLLEKAHQCGMVTTVTSNGMLLDEKHLEKLRNRVDLLAISLDGVPEFHNRMRSLDQAFEIMASRLEGLRQSGIPFGFIFTLTRYNLQDLDWVANFAIEQGAKLLQIHPLEEVGRAKERLAGVRANESQSAYAYLQGMRLQKAFGDRLYVQVDLAHRDVLRAYPGMVFADTSLLENTEGLFADILSPLIIEADGTVVPIQHGFARQYALGNLRQASLKQLAANWRRECYPSFLELCRRVFDELTAPTEIPITDWYEAIASHAEE